MTKIKLVATTRFIDGGTMINKGETFSVTNEALAQEYISRELAKKVEAPAENNEPAPVTEEGGETVNNYAAMTVVQLRGIAKERNITGYTKMDKGELIEAIEATERG